MVYISRHARRRRKVLASKIITIAAVLLVLGAGTAYAVAHHSKGVAVKNNATVTTNNKAAGATTTKPAPKPNACAANSDAQTIIVSISQRHLWACASTTLQYDSAVITGMENLPADLTPVGTYHIYAKQTNLFLNGSDSTGSWHDYVYYWMPFLSNQYGVYGFHDATWRAAGDFGNIDPYSSNASHGCVEMPLATSKWLFNWAAVGATVTIET